MKISDSGARFVKTHATTIAVLALALGSPVLAQEAGGGGINLDAMGASLGEGFKTWLTLGIQVISVIVFMAVGYGVVSKFLWAVNGKANWGEVVMPVLVGAFVLVACAYFFTEAQTLANAISVT